ncbi:MAG TPA: response regulator [Bacillota bacterium]
MLKVLIVEDEKWEREGLLGFLDWHSFGFEMVETACDGIEGLEKADKIRPDIIITDIKMPGMDGISMSKKIKASMPQVKIMILTGYDDFQLAQEAISFKADAYVLKPLEEEEIIPVFQKIVDECLEEKEKTAREDRIRKQLDENLRIARTKFLNDLINGNLDTERLNQQLSDFGMKITSHDEYTIMIIKIVRTLGQSHGAVNPEDPASAGMDGIISLVGNVMQQHLVFSLSFVKEEQMVFCFSSSRGDNGLLDSEIGEIYRTIHSEQGVLSVIGMGEPAASLNEVSRSYVQARQVIEFGMFWSSFEMIHFYQIDSKRNKFVDNMSEFLIQSDYLSKQLLHSVRTSNRDKLFELLEEMFAYLRKNPGADRDFIVSYLQSIINETNVFLYNLNKGLEHSSVNVCKDQGVQLAGLSSLRSMEQGLTGFFENTLQKINEKKNDKDEQIVNKVVELIEQRYMTDLGLQIIAREVFLSPNYLGNIFKKYTGKTFNDYLCEYRMTKAKELLKSPDNKVSRVASAVGISNTSYFCTIFKNTYGMAPGEYQKSFLRNS